ncbi:399_t:CDS:2 [Diversispora eburnea]|uniref:DNA-directed DNA polymerase n=1 Tax=Diversispora eburnea TaxID=1213867 RepID=A0A9N9ACI1_9GLOM|nr:399_t:CDS:2 [Diversispora eburnea]
MTFELMNISYRTFAPLSKPDELIAKLRELADHLASDLKKEGLSGKTISLKFKSVTFNVTSRAKTFSKYIYSADDLFSYGKQDDMKYGVKRVCV